jgi:hypothetical protein
MQVSARVVPGDLRALNVETRAVRLWLEELEEPATAREAADRLLTWLLKRREVLS